MRLAWLSRAPADSRPVARRLLPRWRDLDWHTLAVALALLAVGIAIQHAIAEAEVDLGGRGGAFAGHLRKLAVSAPMLVVGVLARPRWLRRNAWRLYGLALALLLALPWIGDERNGARRWIETPIGFDLQPSELAKIALIVALARVLHRRRPMAWRDWLLPLAVAGVPMLLVAAQPDLGTALTIAPVTLGMVYVAGGSGRRIAVLLVLGTGLLGTAWWLGVGVRDYQRERIDTWVEGFEPEALIEARRGPAYHAYQSRLVVGHAGPRGTGLGRGLANRTGILPERGSDSIFALIAEEAGLVGASGLIVLYALLVVLLLLGASELRDRFPRLVVGGIAFHFAAHLFVHVGVNLGLLPMTGLPLPLFSTGGSSLLATFLALGLALGLGARPEPALDRDAFRSF